MKKKLNRVDMMKIIGIVAAILICVSCAVREPIPRFKDVVVEARDVSRILFIYLNAKYDSSAHKATVELIETKAPMGKLKAAFHVYPKLLSGDWLCSFFDENDKLIEKIEIENPLVIRGEFTDQDKNYQSISEFRRAIDFFIRINLNREISFLKIENITEHNELHEIANINLKEK
ncbi:MAG: hypothetical protein NT007_09940 [Candidatus Kapabacteria bacterium]|nr:hypothetical protein [Candidatus Kapabacteria bacterium]